MKRLVRRALAISKRHKLWLLGGLFVLLVGGAVLILMLSRGPSLEEQVAKNPGDKQVLTDVARQYIEQKEYDKAREMYQKVLEAEKSNTDAFLGIAATYVAEGETAETLERKKLREKARTTLRELIAFQPSEARGYTELSKLLDKDEAIALLKNALLYLPGEPSLTSELQLRQSE